MSFVVSEFSVPLSLSNAEQVKDVGDGDRHRIALGTPLLIGGRSYRVKWDRQYASACLLAERGKPVQRDRRQERLLADGLARRLRAAVVQAVDIDALLSGRTISRKLALEHVAAGGLLQVQGRSCEKRFAVVERRGAARWTTVSESAWPMFRALWDWLRCLRSKGRRAWRDERQLLRQLDAALPANIVKCRREAIEAGRATLARGLDRQAPRLVQNIFCSRIATPEGVVQFLRYDATALTQVDSDNRTVLHHVARDPRLAIREVLDPLFVRVGIATEAWRADEERKKARARANGRAEPDGQATPPIFASDYEGNTPVHLAVMHGDKEAVRRFLQQAAMTDSRNTSRHALRFADRTNRAGQTIWDCALARLEARSADSWLIESLVKYGCQPSAIQDPNTRAEPADGAPACSRSRGEVGPASPGRRH